MEILGNKKYTGPKTRYQMIRKEKKRKIAGQNQIISTKSVLFLQITAKQGKFLLIIIKTENSFLVKNGVLVSMIIKLLQKLLKKRIMKLKKRLDNNNYHFNLTTAKFKLNLM